MNALLLFAMPPDLAPVRTKFLDTTLTYAELRTQFELHITAEQTTPTATTAALTAHTEMLARKAMLCVCVVSVRQCQIVMMVRL